MTQQVLSFLVIPPEPVVSSLTWGRKSSQVESEEAGRQSMEVTSQPGPAHLCNPDPFSDRRYRKVVSNTCEGGVDLQQSPTPLQCPLTPPRGLQVRVRGQAVAVRPGEDVLFEVRQEQVSRAASRGAGPLGGGGPVCGQGLPVPPAVQSSESQTAGVGTVAGSPFLVQATLKKQEKNRQAQSRA